MIGHIVSDVFDLYVPFGTKSKVRTKSLSFPIDVSDKSDFLLEEFGKIWNECYPMIYQSWQIHWMDLSEF